jgi:type II secretion system protein J
VNLRRPNAGRSARGFTLLELLVASVVGAIVLLVINATFFTSLQLGNTTHDHLASDLVLQRALGLVRRDLAGVMLPGGVLSGQLQTTVASSLTQGSYGDQIGPDLYTDTGRIDGWNSFSEVQMVDYYLAPSTDGSNARSLVRVVTRNLLPAQVTTPDVQTLLPSVKEASLQFYDGTQWTDTWDSSVSLTLPTAFKFHLVLATPANSQATPPTIDLVVPVVVMTTTSQAQAAAGGTGT